MANYIAERHLLFSEKGGSAKKNLWVRVSAPSPIDQETVKCPVDDDMAVCHVEFNGLDEYSWTPAKMQCFSAPVPSDVEFKRVFRHILRILMDFEVGFIGVFQFSTHLSRCHSSLMEDQAVEVVSQIGQCQFGLGPGDANRANEQAVSVLLMGKHMLDGGAN